MYDQWQIRGGTLCCFELHKLIFQNANVGSWTYNGNNEQREGRGLHEPYLLVRGCERAVTTSRTPG